MRGARALSAALLLGAVLALLAGCRDNGTGPAQQTGPLVGALAFSTGDTLTFDAWLIDTYGYVIDSSHTTPIWRVLGTADFYAGAAGVTTMLELPFPGAPARLADTLRFQFLSSGDIIQFGFIADAVHATTGALLPPRWDRIAAFSLPTNATWNVGTADSGGLDTLRGTVLGDQGYFLAADNGVRTAFHGYGAGLSSQTIECTVAFSGDPPAVLLIREESPFGTNGRVLILSALVHR